MNLKNLKSAALVVVSLASFAAGADSGRSPEANASFAEMEKMLGVAPAGFKAMPDEDVPAFWEHLKALQMNPKTVLPGKTKELIGLGVAAQVPCRYCLYAHQEFAKLNGASERELREAVATAGIARELSALANGPSLKLEPSPDQVELHAEIAKAFGGTEPDAFKRYPAASLSALWKQVKAVTMNANSALPVKTKALISLAVATQLPSALCVRDYTAMARANGASDQEISEAVAMSGFTRSASTVLNGGLTDETQWRKDIDTIIKHVSQPAPGKKSAQR
ncbi:MAG: carboxymuconolactone decarboxylase family protein [Myxococcaceae bacterium]